MLEETSTEHLKDRIRILENENIKLQNNFLIHQYNQLKSDVRHLEKIIWAAPIISGLITASVLAFSFASPFENILLPVKMVGVIIGIILNFTLFLGLCKNRFFQVYKNRILDDLENRLPIIDEKKGTEEIWRQKDFQNLSGIVHKAPLFFFMAGSTVLFIGSLVGTSVLLTTNILSYAAGASLLTIIFLSLIYKNWKKNSKFFRKS